MMGSTMISFITPIFLVADADVIHCEKSHALLCYEASVNCKQGENCYVNCTGDSACESSIISCPSGAYNCTIFCDGRNNTATEYGCYNSTIGMCSLICILCLGLYVQYPKTQLLQMEGS